MILTVNDVENMGEYNLMCTFSYGVNKIVDLTPLLKDPAFEELTDKEQFVQFGLQGTIFWKNGADISPEYLYEHGKLAA